MIKVLTPVRATHRLPDESGEYLTEIGKIYFCKVQNEFKMSMTSVPIPLYIVGKWYEEQEAYTSEELERKYEQGYVDGLEVKFNAHSIEPQPKLC